MEGRFTPQSFENIFSKYDMDRDGALSLKETFSMMAGHRCAADPFGVSGLYTSFLFLKIYIFVFPFVRYDYKICNSN